MVKVTYSSSATVNTIKQTLTCGSGAVAGSGMVGTDPITRVSVEAKPAVYCKAVLQSSLMSHTYKRNPGHTELHLGDERPPFGYLWGEGGLFSRRGGQPMKISVRMWTACRSAILAVGGLQRPCRTFLILGVARLREEQFIYVETREKVFFFILIFYLWTEPV